MYFDVLELWRVESTHLAYIKTANNNLDEEVYFYWLLEKKNSSRKFHTLFSVSYLKISLFCVHLNYAVN